MAGPAQTDLRPVVMAWRRHRPRAAARLRALREAAGLTQLELAARSGVVHEAISRLERARRSPRAETVRRLATALGVAPADLVAPPAPEPPPDPAPSGRWLTAEEAAALLDRSAEGVRDLLRAGKLRPAVKARVGGTGHPRWLVDAVAVAAYRAPRHHVGGRPPAASPPGFVSLAAFREATGMAQATFYRRLVAGEIASVEIGHRRWIPADELRRLGEPS